MMNAELFGGRAHVHDSADAILLSDGGKAVAAARPLFGPDHIARFLAGVARKAAGALEARATAVNGQRGLIVSAAGVPLNALAPKS